MRQPKRLTTTTAGRGTALAWSPDGQSIAYLLGDEPNTPPTIRALAVIPAGGGPPQLLTDSLDRPCVRRSGPRTDASLDLRGDRRPTQYPVARQSWPMVVSSVCSTGPRVVESVFTGKRRRPRRARLDADRRSPESLRARERHAAPPVAPERRLARRSCSSGTTEEFSVDEQGRHRGARPARQARRRFRRAEVSRRCFASTADRTGRTSTRSTSSASCSPPTATSSSR